MSANPLRNDVIASTRKPSALSSSSRKISAIDTAACRLPSFVNASVDLKRPALETTTEEFDRVMKVNIRGVFLTGREGLRHMVEHGPGGRVINVASDFGQMGRAGYSAYCTSKRAVLALTRAWRVGARGNFVSICCLL